MSDSSDSDFDDLTAVLKDHTEEKIDSGSSSDEKETETKVSKKRRRKSEDEEDEQNLNTFLFGDKSELFKNLEGKQTFYLDVGNSNDNDEDVGEKNNTPAWHDSDDDDYVEVKGQFAKDRQIRKLERVVGKKPKWAELDKKEENADSEDEGFIKQSVGYLKEEKVTKSGLLPRKELSFKKLKNLNRTTQKEGRIMSVEFHPKSTVGIVAGSKGIVSIFAVDGKENRKIHDICYDKFFIKSCKLTPSSEELIIGGTLKDFHIYNLMTGYKQRTRLPKGVDNLKNFQLSSCGKYMAIVGEFGEIHLLHAVTKELLCTMKQEHQSTSLNFTNDSCELYSHSDDNEITIFDIRTQRIKHRFIDDGCVNGTSLAVSYNGKFLATGSRQGFVNLYNCEDVLKSKFPKPLKSISNLTTEITDLKFNHTTELLAICSTDDNKALKLVHVESGSVFSNFPSHLDSIGKPTVLAFSPESGYFGVGTISSEVPLYRLRHYNNY